MVSESISILQRTTTRARLQQKSAISEIKLDNASVKLAVNKEYWRDH